MSNNVESLEVQHRPDDAADDLEQPQLSEAPVELDVTVDSRESERHANADERSHDPVAPRDLQRTASPTWRR
jgi:hypothetical protein